MTPVESYPGGYARRWRRAERAVPRAVDHRHRQHDPRGRLPEHPAGLHTDEAGLQWIGSSYGLVLAGLLLPLAVVGDRRGRKGMLMIGLVIFGAASAAAAFATSAVALTDRPRA